MQAPFLLYYYPSPLSRFISPSASRPFHPFPTLFLTRPPGRPPQVVRTPIIMTWAMFLVCMMWIITVTQSTNALDYVFFR